MLLWLLCYIFYLSSCFPFCAHIPYETNDQFKVTYFNYLLFGL